MFNGVGVGSTVRLAVVKKVGPTYIDFQFIERVGEPTHRAPLPHPYAGNGSGIFYGIEEGNVLLMARGPSNTWYVVSIIPNVTFNVNTQGAENVYYYQNKYPQLNPGEVSLIGVNGQFIDILKNGNIALDAGIGAKSANFELSNLSAGIFTRINQLYSFTEAGRKIEGVIKRDLSRTEQSTTTNTINFLDGEEYDLLLNTIGRSPQNEVQKRSAQIIKSTVRNPALVEKKEITYEYATQFNVLDFENEVKALGKIATQSGGQTTVDISNLKTDITSRQNRRTDTLDLNQQNFNHLIEKVEGTIVDIYGNILDLNRNVIQVPNTTTLKTNGNDVVGLRNIYDYLRRSVKYHFEINSRKNLFSTYLYPPEDQNTNYSENSRFSVDIDAEGLTKINIPASSETGNIPILSRYLTTVDPTDPTSGAFRAQNGVDIQIQQFGAISQENSSLYSGQTIQADDYSPQVINSPKATVGTAFHDIFNIANSIFTNGTLKSSNPIASPNQSTPPVSASINNKIYRADDPAFQTNTPNAGGRSLNLNLDGSMSLNIGADTVDRKSYVVDMAGGTISHYGRDINGRSIIHQSDGDVIIQVGGNQIATDPRFPVGSLPNDKTTFRPGRLEIHLLQSIDGSIPPHKILIDENGITMSTNGSLIMQADNNIILDAAGSVLLNGEQIFENGNYDSVTGNITAAETRHRRSGRS